MAKTNAKAQMRTRRKMHIRKTVVGTPGRPRLCVFRSARHIYAQIVDDQSGRTLCEASSLSPELKGSSGGNREGAEAVGKLLAERAKAAGVSSVVFDRNGFRYHGRVAALAQAARDAELDF